MDDYESLSHSKWECKYHVVFIPKCRRKTYVELRRHLGEVFRRLAEQKESILFRGLTILHDRGTSAEHIHRVGRKGNCESWPCSVTGAIVESW